MNDSDTTRSDTASQLKHLLKEVEAESSASEMGTGFQQSVLGRLGMSWLVLAVFNAVIGNSPFILDSISRAIFLSFALVLALIGACYIDKSNRSPGRAFQEHRFKRPTSKVSIWRIK